MNKIIFCNICNQQLEKFESQFMRPITYQYRCGKCIQNETYLRRTVISFDKNDDIVHYKLSSKNNEYYIYAFLYAPDSDYGSGSLTALHYEKLNNFSINYFKPINILNIDETMNKLYMKLKNLMVLS